MARVEAGWELIPVEELVRRPGRGVEWLLSALSSCQCLLVDQPFVVVVETPAGARVQVAVGAGSLVCEGGCGVSAWRLAEDAWAYGSWVGVGSCERACRYIGPTEERLLLRRLGVEVEEYSGGLSRLLEEASVSEERGVVVLPGSRLLEAEDVPGRCGRLEAVDSLHPMGAVARAARDACVEEAAEPVGPVLRRLHPVVRLAGRPVAWRTLGGPGEVLVLGFKPSGASTVLRLAALLGMLYACGSRAAG